MSSPISTDRGYQNSFLQALHHYFLQRRRLVKQNDIIALPLNTDDVRRGWMFGATEEGTQDADDSDEAYLQCVSPLYVTVFDMFTSW